MSMQNTDTNTNTTSNYMFLIVTWILNSIAMIDRTTVSFILGVLVSALAIINYVLQIKKNLKNK